MLFLPAFVLVVTFLSNNGFGQTLVESVGILLAALWAIPSIAFLAYILRKLLLREKVVVKEISLGDA